MGILDSMAQQTQGGNQDVMDQSQPGGMMQNQEQQGGKAQPHRRPALRLI